MRRRSAGPAIVHGVACIATLVACGRTSPPAGSGGDVAIGQTSADAGDAASLASQDPRNEELWARAREGEVDDLSGASRPARARSG